MTTLAEQAGERKQVANPVAVMNPATGERVETLEACTGARLAEMAARGRATQPQWQALGFEGRGQILRRAQKWVLDNAGRVIDTVVSETGKTREDVTHELTLIAMAFGFWAKKAPKYLADERVRTASPFLLGRKVIARYEPVGLAGIIGPWNYPLVNNIGDAIPALAAGNAVILKPSSVTPLSSLLMEEALRECGILDGVFQVAIGGGALGEDLVDVVDFIMFTGSTDVGRRVMKRAAETLTPVSLELGGKDPMIVLSDADLERAANAAVFWAMQNAGQTCISVERAYVEEPIYEEFVERVAKKATSLRQGVPGAFGSVEVGSFISPSQAELVEAHVQDAVDKGARLLAGGHRRSGQGSFFEPTVLADVDHSMACMNQETFGPTLPIMKVKDTEEAVRLANDSPYGLQASVFTRDISRGEAVARRMQSGAVIVNDCGANYSAFEAPMGGWKGSGVGVRHGPEGIRKYTHRQTIVLTRFAPKKDPYMFPYNRLRSGLLLTFVKLLYGRGSRN